MADNFELNNGSPEEVVGSAADNEFAGKPAGFVFQEGGQRNFFAARDAFEVLFHGTRGNGKTAALVMAFAHEVGKGYGSAWTGIIFRHTYQQLNDVVKKTKEFFVPIFGDRCKFNQSDLFWEWVTGERLYLSYMSEPKHYDNHHGKEYAFIGWEELTNWSTNEMYVKMMSTLRTSKKGVPLMVRSTTNPSGVGHNWVKARFRLDDGRWYEDKVIVRDDGRLRVAIYGNWEENTKLVEANPDYIKVITADVADAELVKAWAYGSWDITSGGMFDDLWKPQHHIVPRFEPPQSWNIYRAFDWGGTSPFSVGWWAVSDGTDVWIEGERRRTVRGDMFRIAEWYGWNGRPNEGLDLSAFDISRGIVEREIGHKWRYLHNGTEYCRVLPGPADSAIFASGASSLNIARDMEKPVMVEGNQKFAGASFRRANKKAGTRVGGWQKTRARLMHALPQKGKPREKPGLFVVADECPNFARTMLGLARDEKNRDDIANNLEDHIADETRYMVLYLDNPSGVAKSTGLW